MILDASQPSTFITTLQTILLGFLTIVVPAIALWIKTKLDSNHEVLVKAASAVESGRIDATIAANASAQASAEISQKADSIVRATDGINSGLQTTIQAQQDTAKHLADMTEKDKQIASLTKKVNGGDCP